MFLEKFLASLGAMFTGLFNEAKKIWLEFDEAIKTAILQASGLIAILNANVAATPDIIWQLIETKYPGITQASVTAALVKANNTVNAINTLDESSTFAQALTTLQGYLISQTGNTWITIVRTVVVLLADIFSPTDTPIQKVEAVLEYVYQDIVKGDVPLAKAA